MTINVTSVNDAPAGTDNTITTNEDTAHTFTALEFGFTDPNDSPAKELTADENTRIATVGSGTLNNNGIAVTAGQFVTVADINAGLLVFTPAATANGSPEASFTFQVNDDYGDANHRVLPAYPTRPSSDHVTSVNDAPAGTDNTITTNEDTAHTFTALEFGFTDPNDSPANALAAVEITTLPGADRKSVEEGNGADRRGGSVTDINAEWRKFKPAAN